MDSIEEKIGNVLNNPELMQKIMSMAQAMNPQSPDPTGSQNQPPTQPEIDLGMLQKFSGLAKQGNIDKEQQNLLRALNPYLSRDRLSKLENAMRAAKMAKIAANFLGTQGGKISTHR